MPPRVGVVPATNDVKRGTLGCDVGAVSPGSWHRGENPYATPPPVVPEGLRVPGQVPVRSSVDHVQVRFSPGKVLARLQEVCGFGARRGLA